MISEQNSHRQWAVEKVQEVIDSFEVRPILFIGSGFSQRYIEDAPNWDDLLRKMISQCPDEYINRPFEYFDQQYDNPRIGTEIADGYAEWAWDVKDSGEFPDELYDTKNREIFLKHKVAEFFNEISPKSLEDVDKNQEELEILRNIGPHAIITTNYDSLIETVFPDEYNKIVGQDIYEIDYTSIGEIFKIHGCCSVPEEIIITEQDYEGFIKRKKYLSAKLLTYFAEHPVIIIGYDANDENITQILEDVDLVTSVEDDESDLIKNIFHMDWCPGITDSDHIEDYKVVLGKNNQRVRIRSISSENYGWAYEAATYQSEMTGVKIKALRNILNSTYKIVSEDAPKKTVQVEMMKQVSEEEELSTLLGVAPMDDSTEQRDLLRQYLRLRREDQIEGEPSIENRIEVAALAWSFNRTMISPDEEIIEYRQAQNEFSLNLDRINTLFQSSLYNGLQGIDWIVAADNYRKPLKRAAEEIEDYRAAQRLQYNLFVLGEKEYLDIMCDNIGGKFMDLRLQEFQNSCSIPLEERLEAYSVPNTVISFANERVTTADLLGNQPQTEKLLSELSSQILTDGFVGSHKSDFKKLELTKLANRVQQESE